MTIENPETVIPDPEVVETIEIPVGQQADEVVEPVVDPEEEPLPEGDTFDRKYVEDLRAESAKHRTAAKEAQAALQPVQERLFALLVAGTGRLADPTDLPFDAALLEDGALEPAIDALLAKKPHLASRRVVGDVGQGAGGSTPEVGLLQGLLHAGA